MKQLLLTLFFVSSSFGSAIGDFAPTKVGSVWKYSYIEENQYVGHPLYRDSLSIEIELLSKQMRGNDTLILLNIKEEGRSKATQYNVGVLFDTARSAQFIDTAIISSDLISSSGGNRGKVFPFWKSHYVDIGALSRDTSGGDTIYVLQYGQYRQNVGFYSYRYEYLGNNVKEITIQLVGYYEKVIPVSAHYVDKNIPKIETSHSDKLKIISLTNAKSAYTAFSITGKRIQASGNLPVGIVISPKSNAISH